MIREVIIGGRVLCAGLWDMSLVLCLANEIESGAVEGLWKGLVNVFMMGSVNSQG